MVLWKCFICYQGMLPPYFIYLIPWTCMPCFYIFSCLITFYYALITSLILDSSEMHVVCIIGYFLYYTCWTNPIILWKHFKLQFRYILFFFLYAWFLLLSSLFYFCFLVSVDLQINCYNYFNLLSKDLYLGFRGVLSYDTFSIDNLTPKLRLGFQRHSFLNKESYLEFYFLFYFPFLKK